MDSPTTVLQFVPSLPASLARFLLLCLAVLVFGCDSSSAPASTQAALFAPNTLAVPLNGRTSADYYYDLAPLNARERFEATLVGSAGALRLRFLGTGGGRGSVALETSKAHPADAVTLHYMEDGAIIATRSFEGKARATYEAGSSDREPDSVHYVQRPDGSYEIVFDYKDDDAVTGPRTTVTALGGDRLDVTHIRFVVDDAGVGTPELLEFTSASEFSLR